MRVTPILMNFLYHFHDHFILVSAEDYKILTGEASSRIEKGAQQGKYPKLSWFYTFCQILFSKIFEKVDGGGGLPLNLLLISLSFFDRVKTFDFLIYKRNYLKCFRDEKSDSQDIRK